MIVVLTLLLLTGCTQPQKVHMPEWIIQPPQDTTHKLYGTGAGNTVDAAKLQALSSIAAHIYIFIKTSMNTPEHFIQFEGDETTRKRVLKRVKVQVKNLNFTGYSVEDKAQINQQQLLLASIDRPLLFSREKKRLDAKVSAFKSTIAQGQSAPSFEQFIQRRHLNQHREAIMATLEILHALDAKFDAKEAYSLLQANDRKYSALKQSFQIQLMSDASAIAFITPLKEALLAEGIAVNTSHQDNTDKIVVLLSATSTKKQTLHAKYLKTELNIITKDGDKTLGSSLHFLHGTSSESFSFAKKDAVKHLTNKIDSVGIFTVLGF